jgi:hypothetical protein
MEENDPPFSFAIDLVLGSSNSFSAKHDSSDMTCLENMVVSSPLVRQSGLSRVAER